MAPSPGVGVGLTAGSDFAIAATGTNFVPAYTMLGTNPDGGSTWLLTQLLGPRRALEFFILGEPMNAETALSLGLVNRVVPADKLTEEVDALARRIAKGPAFAYASVKRRPAAAPATNKRRPPSSRESSDRYRPRAGRRFDSAGKAEDDRSLSKLMQQPASSSADSLFRRSWLSQTT